MRKNAPGEVVWESRANQEIVRVLEESKSMTDSVYDELPIVIVMVNDERRVLKLNREGERCFGALEAEALGKDLFDLVADRSMAPLSAYFGGSKTRTAFDDEAMIGQERRFFHWQISPVYTNRADGRRVHIMIGHDMTESRAALEALLALNNDLEVAGNVQSMLLPDVNQAEGAHFVLAAHYEPSTQVSGDLWWFRAIPGKGLLAVMIDVMGHGSGAAMAAACIAGSMNQAVGGHSFRDSADIRAFVIGIDEAISAMFKKTLMVSLVALWFPEGGLDAEMISLGFPSIVYFPADGPRQRISSMGNPAGLGLGQESTTSKRFRMHKGDRVVCFTDGCYEFLRDGRQFGRRRFEEALDAVRPLPPSGACAALKAALDASRDTPVRDDDMTILIVDGK